MFREESFVETWLENLRQHARLTVSDGKTQERIRAYHTGAEPPNVTHYLAAERMNKQGRRHRHEQSGRKARRSGTLPESRSRKRGSGHRLNPSESRRA